MPQASIEIKLKVETDSENKRVLQVLMSGDDDLSPFFMTVLQSGFQVRARVGINVREVICGSLAVSEDYLENDIKTLFLNGKPVDDMDRSLVENGAVLALSAAMPGLVGATMRRGGVLSGMRSGITDFGSNASVEGRDGYITIKLFNVLAKEMGPHFLKRGLSLSPEKAGEILFQAFPETCGRSFAESAIKAGYIEDASLINKVTEGFEKIEFIQENRKIS